jgi:hypothetical protein
LLPVESRKNVEKRKKIMQGKSDGVATLRIDKEEEALEEKPI